MSQFRNTNDLKLSVLRRCQELTNGNSPFDSDVVDYLNQVYLSILTGGVEFNIEVDEPWTWARARVPLVLELQPMYNTGTIALTQGSEAGTFSVAPSFSAEGWFLKIDNRPEVFRLATHTAASTAVELDAAYTGDTGSLNFRIFKLDYDLVASYMLVNSENDKLDFIESGTTVLTATLTHGAYTPDDFATEVALELNATGGTPAYTCSYSSLTRKFTIGSDLAGGAVFKPQGAGTNAYRSAWDLLGLDYENKDSASSFTSTYPLSAIIRLIEPAKVYYGNTSGLINGYDTLAMQKHFPMVNVQQGIPTNFAVVREKSDGRMTVRMSHYPDKKIRVEFDYIGCPKDLKDNTSSAPKIPRKFNRILEFGATYYILKDKNDTDAQTWFQLAQQMLNGMIKFNRKELQRIGLNFGEVVARPDQMPNINQRLRYGYDVGSV